MQKRTIFLTFFAAVFVYLTSCSDSKNIGSAAIVSKIIFRSKNIVRPISQLVEKQMNYS